MQMVGEQLEEGLIYTVYIEKVQVRRGPGQGQRWYQRMNVWARSREEHRMVRMVKAGPWENLAEHLVPAFQEGDLVFVKTFLGTYRVFTTTEQVLHLLFRRYGRSLRGRDRQGGGLEMRNTVSSLLGTWMDQYAEDFTQPPGLPCLKLLVGYAQVYLPGSTLECRAIALLSWRSHLEPIEAEPKAHLSAPEQQMPPGQHPLPVPPPVAVTGALPEPEEAPSPPLLPAPEFVPVLGQQIEPEALGDVAPAPELKVALAPPPLLPTVLGPVTPVEVPSMPTLIVETAPSSDVAPAAMLEEVTSPSLSPVPELEALPPPPPVSPTHFKSVPFMEPQPLNLASAATALEGEASLAPPPEPVPRLDPALGQATPPEPSCTCTLPLEIRLSEENANLLAFPPELVAQQLTRMDVDLFKKVVPYHCLGSIWSQRNKKCKEEMAPTVHATITHFNRVINYVMSTCVGNQSMKDPARARVVEHWIEVARECRILHNQSSFYAVISGLQSYPLLCLLKTWEEVSRDSFCLFLTLSEIYWKEHNVSHGSELIIKRSISKFSTLEANPQIVQRQHQQQERGDIQGVVPCLRTFLTEFLLLEYAMPEYLDGRKINFEKKRKEYQMVEELQQLQAGCCYEALVPHESFGAWFVAMEQLGEKDQ
ncbi:ral guanine nucleotide dissociation stimulator-like [Dasypus novemcinctus]|uniref:ral guanine nucleotide dissociation stimulator-like n=1 Tax=Dasypus novemcinctus TaxID=9361 RepID=UPI00265F9DAA|nr:ral guanine nucleotide dissociation stimulator-like [Dasypus novemcinctus]